MAKLPTKFVPADELRRRFNKGMYWQRAQAGELRQLLQRNGHPTTEQSGQPFCTRSQITAYLDQTGVRVAVVHQYLLPDGTLGGSGRPDPMELVEAGEVFRLPRRG